MIYFYQNEFLYNHLIWTVNSLKFRRLRLQIRVVVFHWNQIFRVNILVHYQTFCIEGILRRATSFKLEMKRFLIVTIYNLTLALLGSLISLYLPGSEKKKMYHSTPGVHHTHITPETSFWLVFLPPRSHQPESPERRVTALVLECMVVK